MVAKRKIVMVLVDGIGDVSIPQLHNLTPLEVAHTPTMDAIAGEVRERSVWQFAYGFPAIIVCIVCTIV